MATKGNDWTVITVRVPRELRDQLRVHVVKMGYANISEWLRDMMREALHVSPLQSRQEEGEQA
ncbi:MAG: ribbon-helix-helix domain-containing protein [Thermofilaceae archaeon]|nr:ribbon-helix-helix domain-containing protein [Thermofilaceae archaeon]MDW8004906.1 ribbon-helix-helix domain-containing protein [Thermofilaceae archaeon]